MTFIPPKDRTGETSTSNSQTIFAVAGAFDASFNRFSAHMSVGDTTLGYVAEPGAAFKVGLLTYSAANEVTVTTVYETKGMFSSGGTKEVCMGLPASEAALLKRANAFTDATDATAANAGGAFTIAGGLAVGKKLFVGTDAAVGGTLTAAGVATFYASTSGEQIRLQNIPGAPDYYTIGRRGADGVLQLRGNQATFSGFDFLVNNTTSILTLGAATTFVKNALEITSGIGLVINPPSSAAKIDFETGGALNRYIQSDATNFYIINGAASAGVYLAQSSTSWIAYSDRRVKENVETLSVLDQLGDFRAVRYVSKATGQVEIGIIAQEQVDAWPEFITRGADDDDVEIDDMTDPRMWGASYDRFGVVALQGVKELLARVEQLEAGQGGGQ